MKNFKKILASLLVFVMVLSMGLVPAAEDVTAASKKNVYINPYSATVATYCTGDQYSRYSSTISIVGCSKKSEIKNLKSDNKNIKVSARDGYIRVEFGDKAGKAKITCKVKGVKLSTTFTVKKYSNPFKSIKLGKTNITSKYKKNWTYRQTKQFKNQKLNIQMNKNWKISSIYVYNSSGSQSFRVNSNKFNKKISIKGNYSYFTVYCYNTKTNVSEAMSFYKSNY